MIQEWPQPHDREADAGLVAEGDGDDWCGGTGSSPPACQGWHLHRRRPASMLPFKAPCVRIASAA